MPAYERVLRPCLAVAQRTPTTKAIMNRALRDELTRAGASEGEATELAALLVRAAEPARFDVPRDEVDRVFARIRQRRRPRQLPRVAVATAVLAVAVLAVVLFLPSQQESVQARSLAALGGDDTVLHLR